VEPDAERAVRLATGAGLAVTGCARLTGGGFAAVHRVELAGGSAAVVKVAPTGPGLLSYERGLAEAETAYLRLVAAEVPELPLPRVLAAGPGWLVMTHLPGTPLTALPDGAAVRRDLGAAVARLHRVTGPHFGYCGDRVRGATWRATFLAAVDELLADAVRFGVALPAVRPVVAAAGGVLDAVTRPALLHFDLWDGNVLGGPAGLTGLVDGERWLWGDPLLDLVSPALGRRIEAEPDHPFLAGYGPVQLDPRRLALYRVHLYLVMLVEMPGRGGTDPGRRDWISTRLAAELADLDRG
jgi:fructosamine-3-kinase